MFDMGRSGISDGSARDMHRAMVMYRRRLDADFRSIGLQPGQPAILRCVLEGGGVSQKELAEGCLVTPATLSRSLDSMEKQGLIVRVANADKRRTMSVELTEAGHQAAGRAMEVRRAFFEELMDGVPDADKEAFDRVVRRMMENLRKKAGES